MIGTSRPEGVDKAAFARQFVVMGLKALDDEQQQSMILKQLPGTSSVSATFFSRLSAFASIRRKHDDNYAECFPPSYRRRIEARPPVDLLVLPDGGRDKSRRAHHVDGGRPVSKIAESAAPKSRYLQELCALLDSDTLDSVDQVVAEVSASGGSDAASQPLSKDAVREALSLRMAQRGQRGSAAVSPSRRTSRLSASSGSLLDTAKPPPVPSPTAVQDEGLAIGSKLGLLLHKLSRGEPGLTAAVLWRRIVRRTDEIYEAQEGMLSVLDAALRELRTQVVGGAAVSGRLKRESSVRTSILFANGGKASSSASRAEQVEILLGNLKDPVRVHEKALDDYAGLCEGDELPEAYVLDVLRARLVCSHAEHICNLLEKLATPWSATVDAEGKGDRSTVKLTVIRVKSKFGTFVDPTHFRNVLLNIELRAGDRQAFVEVPMPRPCRSQRPRPAACVRRARRDVAADCVRTMPVLSRCNSTTAPSLTSTTHSARTGTTTTSARFWPPTMTKSLISRSSRR